MNRIKSTISFLNVWNDQPSKEKLFHSTMGKEAQKAECENILKEVAMRFERSPNPNTLKIWASDIIDAGFNHLMLKDISKSIPFKFERHPTLAQIMELLRPNMAIAKDDHDELTSMTLKALPLLKERFLKLGTQEVLDRMRDSYRKNVLGDFPDIPNIQVEKLVLLDWMRAYCSTRPEAVIAQGKVSNQKFLDGDKEYFLHGLRIYLKNP